MNQTLRRYVVNSVKSALARLPRSVQVRLFCELAWLLSDRADEVIGLMPSMPGAQQALDHAAENLRTQAAKILAPVLTRLPRAQQVEIFQQLAGVLDVPAAEVAGRNGTLAGYLDDGGVFVPYLCDRSWFWNAIEFINSVFYGRAGGTFIDIGANIGAVVVPIAKANPSVDCFAFEPEANNFLALTHNIARNGVSNNVKAYELALAEADGAVTFELADTNFGDHRLRKPGAGTARFNEEVRATIEVSARRLDDVLAAHALAPPLVVKIDVQGAELMVLAGGQTILRAADVLVIEYWPYGMRRLGSEPRQFLETFSQIFSFAAQVKEHAIGAADFLPFPAMVAELEAFADNSDTAHLNLVLTKRPIVAPDSSG